MYFWKLEKNLDSHWTLWEGHVPWSFSLPYLWGPAPVCCSWVVSPGVNQSWDGGHDQFDKNICHQLAQWQVSSMVTPCSIVFWCFCCRLPLSGNGLCIELNLQTNILWEKPSKLHPADPIFWGVRPWVFWRLMLHPRVPRHLVVDGAVS